MSQKNREYLCNQDCSNCEAIENPQLAVLLNVLALKFGEEVRHIANRVCANMTCCPICRVDDFCHYDGDRVEFCTPITRIEMGHRTCQVAKMAIEIFNESNKKGTNKSATRP